MIGDFHATIRGSAARSIDSLELIGIAVVKWGVVQGAGRFLRVGQNLCAANAAKVIPHGWDK